MSKSAYGGGLDVKASTLGVGDTIRDPRNKERILIVESLGSQIFARGFEGNKRQYHIYLNADQIVTKVTNASTETTEGVV